MKKIILFLVFAVTVSVANAWSRKCDEAVMIIANEHLTPEAAKVVKKYLGKSFTDDVQYLYQQEKEQFKTMDKKARRAAAEIHYLHLNSELQPRDVKGKDALKATEQALEILRNHKSHSKAEVTTALRTVINLMCDMHNLSKIRIQGIKHSYRDFKYIVPGGEFGSRAKEVHTGKWSNVWNRFDGGYGFFSANYWAYDMRIFIGDKYADYAKGTLREWVTENGALAEKYLGIYKPKQVVAYMDRRWTTPVAYNMMIKASCRLAALLNETIK